MNRARTILDKITELVSIVIFTVMVLLVTFQVFVRYVLNSPSAFSETLTRYLFVWLVMITATYAFGKREHMCITFIKDKCSWKQQYRISVFLEAVTLLFAAAVMIYGGIRISVRGCKIKCVS